MKVLENTPAALSLGKLCDEHGYSYEWIDSQKPHLIKNGIRIQCNTENFVPMVVPGLSASSSSSSHSSTSMTPSRPERNHPTSSSSSSTWPTTTVLSDSETRERDDLSGVDSHPSACVKFTCWTNGTGRPVVAQANPKSKTKWKRKPRKRTGRPVVFRHTGMAAKIQRESRGWQSSWTQSSHEPSLEPTPTRSADLGKHSVYTHFS